MTRPRSVYTRRMEHFVMTLFRDPVTFLVSLLGLALVVALVVKGIERAALTKPCAQCGERVKKAAVICKHCGATLA